MTEQLVQAQTVVINELRMKLDALSKEYNLVQRSLERIAGVLEGVIYQYGEKDSMIRIKKKHMMRVNVGFIINTGIEPASKDLIVTLTPSENVRPREVKAVNPKEAFTCQSMTMNAKDAEKSSNSSTKESTTTPKTAPDVVDVAIKSSPVKLTTKAQDS